MLRPDLKSCEVSNHANLAGPSPGLAQGRHLIAGRDAYHQQQRLCICRGTVLGDAFVSQTVAEMPLPARRLHRMRATDT